MRRRYVEGMLRPSGRCGLVTKGRTILLTVAAIVISGAPAFAQIYAWRDAAGNLVLSDRKQDPSAQTFAVPDTQIRVTRPPADVPVRDQLESLVQEHATRQNLRPELVRAVIQVESGFNPRARSNKGAMGLMQLMPATAAGLGVVNPYDPDDNIRGGTTYLRQLLDRYNGDERLALAAYNAGAGAVDRYGKRIPPYRETIDYVRKIGLVTAPRVQPPAIKVGSVVYKTIETVDGRPVARYSTQRPSSGDFQVVVQ